jgi:inorganic pyrophosphatase/exopolyphosphatase
LDISNVKSRDYSLHIKTIDFFGKKMKKMIVTSGNAYADIDVVACASAYRELLECLGKKASSVITAPWNQTIPLTMHSWPIGIEKVWTEDPATCQFVLVDLSDPNHREKFVPLECIIEVFDHHSGHEEYWKKRLQEKAYIEPIGACATLIWEQFKKYDLCQKISPVNANLLYTAIFANTLNFRSYVAHERDRQAAQELLSYTTLPTDWKACYYEAVGRGFEKDLISHLLKDTKQIEWKNEPFCFGQIEVWDAQKILSSFRREFLEKEQTHNWIVNIASISEGMSFLFCNQVAMKKALQEAVSGDIYQEFIVTPRLWLRKEIMKKLFNTGISAIHSLKSPGQGIPLGRDTR